MDSEGSKNVARIEHSNEPLVETRIKKLKTY